ncbi:hypothetical protein QBC40DRAFT_265477 [Triangularia verruculosa]|uniref:Uncharacterized protein n=1 Tax=Triangularia verruculosa TaxID=2587418 RepID=A0AAN6XHV7_9PEZI|nr:hypothetical protein QBC40DRAFT_265477 [Triangularia verruculosa]
MTTESTFVAAAPQPEGEKTATASASQTTVENNGKEGSGSDKSVKKGASDKGSEKLKASLPVSIPKKPTSSDMYSACHYD